MTPTIVGRENEKSILEKLLKSNAPELLALYGRRRVGKTFLIKTYYKDHLTFFCSGQYQGKTNEQLVNFAIQIGHYFPEHKPPVTPSSWQAAFRLLENCLDTKTDRRKKVLFFDELPWLDSHKSGFLSAFSYFWNMYASKRTDILVVICGSAASWIIEKVLNNRGGLHDRVTQRIRLLPFTLGETEKYLAHRNIKPDRYQLLQLYMALGGIPQYLNAVVRGRSTAQNIDKICFSKDGALANEFDNLYQALFNHPEKHIQIIKALAKKNKGLTRTALLATGKLLTGGGITTALNELTESGFILKVYPYGKQEKNALYRLTDEFSLFYLKFMQQTKANEKNNWQQLSTTTAYQSWCGYAFENLCFTHIEQLKKGLQIAGIHSSYYSWQVTGTDNDPGAQIDLLIDRADNCINIFEMKFSNTEFTITKKYAGELSSKLAAFRKQVKSKKTLLFSMLTTYGVSENDYKTQLVDNELKMEILFE
ncbi:MAG TPA: ATPase [Chitinophagaceae bacterium]|nr:ATPase [Chitinophagaceae bacterium]